jgi:hypothetical protein
MDVDGGDEYDVPDGLLQSSLPPRSRSWSFTTVIMKFRCLERKIRWLRCAGLAAAAEAAWHGAEGIFAISRGKLRV